MSDPKHEIADVNHFGNTVVVKFEDGRIALLRGAAVRQADDAERHRGSAVIEVSVELALDPWSSE